MKIVAGTKLVLRPGFGMGAPVVAFAEEAPEPHKYSQAFAYRLEDEEVGSSWAYIDQVVRIISQPEEDAA